MRTTIRNYFAVSVTAYEDKAREAWIQEYPAQIALCGTQIWWTAEVNQAFTKLEDGYENALKDYLRKQVNQLNTLIGLLLGSLNSQERQKVMTICTIDVHSRDVVGKLIQMRIESAQAFQWQSQLRHRWDGVSGDCYANICDAELMYWYEYLGNTPRLVITPLTDRCYITLTQSLHLIMGGAPAGPAETTKDLGRALGMMVYVFNCSEQMDVRSIGNIYKGLAQTGAWGCFDEFNRITVEVLSVVAVQVKAIQDAIRDKKTKFVFYGEDIALNHTVGLFITMNPGYAGRSELPELLSKQDHYDWGLRAIKSVLVVAGSLKRGDPGRPEDQVLMRALRDFNIPKIVSDDTPFLEKDAEFEASVRKATSQLNLQPEENFILKVVQLQELIDVRHSVFILGNAGQGKRRNSKCLCGNPRNFFRSHARQANMSADGPKWIILDGDIDPMWIDH
ncbi:Dynein beta chain, ciliary [Orchesella cincta]|uniref:Dynein beta chain, ciliary n=1 Tax=Orchesella cincta TaxID=48709 RepID=A0A1D2MUZ1_ORCCI|nr:Dynein beta chain, ciliary [Orchesella cincta]